LLKSTEFQSRGNFKEIYGISVDNLREVTTDWINSERPAINSVVGFGPDQLIGDEATVLPTADENSIQQAEAEAERIEAATSTTSLEEGRSGDELPPATTVATIPTAAAATSQGKQKYISMVNDSKPSKKYNPVMNTLLGDSRTGSSKNRQGIINDLQGLETKFGTIRTDGKSIQDLVADTGNYSIKTATNDIQNLLKNLRDKGNEEVKEATKMQGGGLLKKKGSKKNKVEKKKGRKTKRKMYTKKKKGNSKKHKKKSKVKRNTRRK